MPAGYSTRCKVCNHPRRVEIERWHSEEGASYREIQSRLDGEISYSAIGRHFKEHCNVQEEATIRYQASQVQFEKHVSARLTDVERLDDSIDRAHRLSKVAEEQIRTYINQGSPPPKALVDLYSAASSELRQTNKTKMEALGDDPESKKADAIQSWADMVVMAIDDDETEGEDASA